MGIHQTLEQQRAKEAWECVLQAKQKFGQDIKEYTNVVKKFPSLVMTNGLGQALAFLAAKAGTREDNKTKKKEIKIEKAEGLLYTHIEGWLAKESQPEDLYQAPYSTAVVQESAEAARLLCRIATGDSTIGILNEKCHRMASGRRAVYGLVSATD